MSGPLLDRIDLHVSVPAVPWKDLAELGPGSASEPVRGRIEAARVRQIARGTTNAALPDAGLDARVAAEPAARALLGEAVDRLALSARAVRRVLRVARSIADLAGTPEVGHNAVAEALGFRDRRRD